MPYAAKAGYEGDLVQVSSEDSRYAFMAMCWSTMHE
mgnify:CR=1 FL=1